VEFNGIGHYISLEAKIESKNKEMQLSQEYFLFDLGHSKFGVDR
jgi:hypothetical protein